MMAVAAIVFAIRYCIAGRCASVTSRARNPQSAEGAIRFFATALVRLLHQPILLSSWLSQSIAFDLGSESEACRDSYQLEAETDLGTEGPLRVGFVAYIRELTKVIGHADPRETVADFLLRTTGDGGRRSLHPIAAVNGDGAGLGCSGELVLATVRELVMPSTTHRGPLEAWIIDDKSFPKKGWHSAAGIISIAGSSASRRVSAGDVVDPQPASGSADLLNCIRAGRDQR